MELCLDHVVVVVPSLVEATREFGAAGFTVAAGGRHDAVPTENALVCFDDGSYLELLSARDTATRVELRALRSTGGWERHLRGVSAVARRLLPHLAGPDGVADWALRSGVIARQAARARQLGIVASGPVAMSRERPDGERVVWEVLLPESAVHPIWVADRTPRARRVPADSALTTHANGARGVRAIRVRAAVVPLATLELAEALDAVPELLADGTSALSFGGWRVEIVSGEPEGACAVVLADCGRLPERLHAWGVSGEPDSRFVLPK